MHLAEYLLRREDSFQTWILREIRVYRLKRCGIFDLKNIRFFAGRSVTIKRDANKIDRVAVLEDNDDGLNTI